MRLSCNVRSPVRQMHERGFGQLEIPSGFLQRRIHQMTRQNWELKKDFAELEAHMCTENWKIE